MLAKAEIGFDVDAGNRVLDANLIRLTAVGQQLR